MKIKENIYDAIAKMNINELTLLYEQIRLLQNYKNVPVKKKQRFSIEQILQMTGSSESSWSEAVTEGRTERI